MLRILRQLSHEKNSNRRDAESAENYKFVIASEQRERSNLDRRFCIVIIASQDSGLLRHCARRNDDF